MGWGLTRQRGYLALMIIQFSSVTQSCLTLCGPMDCSMPGFNSLY